MKIGAKEMKKAYKDVKLDQIDVCLLFTITLFLLALSICILIVQATPVITYHISRRTQQGVTNNVRINII